MGPTLRVVHSQRLLQDWLRVALHLNLVHASREGEGEKVTGGISVYPNVSIFYFI